MRLPTKGSGPAALLIAILALLVAISGTSYAAVMIGKGSVDTSALHNGAVTSPKIAPEAVTSWKLHGAAVTRPKIHQGAVNSAKVEDGSLRAVDFGKGELPTGSGTQGPQGTQGERGPKGDPGEPGADGQGSAYTSYDNAAPNSLAIPILVVNSPQNLSGLSYTKQGSGPDFLGDGAGINFTRAGTYRISYGTAVQLPLGLVTLTAYATQGAPASPTNPKVPGSEVQETFNESILASHNIERSFVVSVDAGDNVTVYLESNQLDSIRTSAWFDVQLIS